MKYKENKTLTDIVVNVIYLLACLIFSVTLVVIVDIIALDKVYLFTKLDMFAVTISTCLFYCTIKLLTYDI